ncbi:hypothetical protein FRB99_002265 [Tulasnella sp. 403]|nr:hypothetical protein FRB99_002265 [Tulasnella sp. 403]
MLSLPKSVISAVILASTATAHFTLDYPTTRGFNHDIEAQFCGGFANAASNRSQFPLNGGWVSINSKHASANFVTLISLDQNPTSFTQFNTTPTGQNIPFLIPYVKVNGAGEVCLPANIAPLNLTGATEGANATILVQYNGGDAPLYQCADVTLTSAAINPPTGVCTNVSTVVGVFQTEPPQDPKPSSSASGAAATSTSRPNGAEVLSSPLVPLTGLAAIAGLFVSLF